jgi:hypothetical protein
MGALEATEPSAKRRTLSVVPDADFTQRRSPRCSKYDHPGDPADGRGHIYGRFRERNPLGWHYRAPSTLSRGRPDCGSLAAPVPAAFVPRESD